MNPSNNGSLPIKTDPTLKPIAPNVDASNLMKNWGFSTRFINNAPNTLGWLTLEDVCSSLMGDDTQDFSEELRRIGVSNQQDGQHAEIHSQPRDHSPRGPQRLLPHHQ